MFSSPSDLTVAHRTAVVQALDAALVDGIDFHSQIRAAHWNVKGPLFGTLHPWLDGFAVRVAEYVDQVAEREVQLGGVASGGAKQAASRSRLDPWDLDVHEGVKVVQALADRLKGWLTALRDARKVAEAHEDTDTADLITQMLGGLEKDGWYLLATATAK